MVSKKTSGAKRVRGSHKAIALGREIEGDGISRPAEVENYENLEPKQAAEKLFALMDGIENAGHLPLGMAQTIEQITQLLRCIAKTKNPESYKIFREDEHFKKLKIPNKHLINNSPDRALHARIIDYLKKIGIQTTPEEQMMVLDYFGKKDHEKRQDTLSSYAQNGLLTLRSAIEKGVLRETSSTPGDFSSIEDLQEFSLEDHGNLRGYELTTQTVNDALFYGRNGFFQVVLERNGEEIDRAGQLPKQEIENRLRNSMVFVIKSEKVTISRQTDNTRGEDMIDRDIKPEEIDCLLVSGPNLALAQKVFGNLPVRIIAVGDIKSNLHNLFEGPYTLPDYRGEIEKLVKKEGSIWCHIARLPLDTYPIGS
jgi:hypothetical protein